ncbi:glutaminyl-peptide cyclotransferase [Actinoalloteichus sp. AHMU CJ021]|uniref:glutaminyl-peptide cyclotransferase n=1 Tax=Actinoalloteichus TaxID=65496 RepID=UPI000CA036D6|nr:glutaminyl-peptide cyclotransferase [Actinoalloteichus sp. AHMU CJ021]
MVRFRPIPRARPLGPGRVGRGARPRRAVLGLLVAPVLVLAACFPPAEEQDAGSSEDFVNQAEQDVTHGGSVPQRLAVDVIEVLPHDVTAFTQGLEVADGVLYEATGRVGSSWVRATDLGTGERLAHEDLPPPLFGEGITVVDDRLWQLTWQDGTALLRDRHTLRELDRVEYAGEGWGICHDGDRLVMSDGTDVLTFRDPETFAELGSVAVTNAGAPQRNLNELECVDGGVWANVWFSEDILRIDPGTGAVTDVVDASGLLPPEEQAGVDVLNGIAALPGTDEFLITGKLWPSMFRVRFVDG